MQVMQNSIHTFRTYLTLFFCIFAFAGCASQKPQVEMLDDYNFSLLNTFYVRPPLNSVNQTIENHIASSINEILIQKGLSPVSREEADIEVAFFPSTALRDEGKSVSIGLGTGVFGRSGSISLGSIFNIPVGDQVTQYQNLQIDIVKNGEFIYSAAGSAELETHDSITIQNALTALVRELLEQYPSKATEKADE